MPHPEHARSHLTDGLDVKVAQLPEVRAMRDHVVAGTEDDVEVREALSHCPQCGSGHFIDYRAESRPSER
jgi:hypothetical protein